MVSKIQLPFKLNLRFYNTAAKLQAELDADDQFWQKLIRRRFLDNAHRVTVVGRVASAISHTHTDAHAHARTHTHRRTGAQTHRRTRRHYLAESRLASKCKRQTDVFLILFVFFFHLHLASYMKMTSKNKTKKLTR